MGPLLTVLQRGYRLCLRAEVTVPNVIGGLQAQLVGGEGPQPETRKGPVTAETSACPRARAAARSGHSGAAAESPGTRDCLGSSSQHPALAHWPV